MKKYLPFLLLGFFFLIPRAYAAINFVNATTTFSSTNASPLTLSQTTIGGNLLVITEGNSQSNSSNTTPTDSAGNAWTLVATSSLSGASTGELSMYDVPNSLAVATASCNFLGSGNTNESCTLIQISGAAKTNPIDTFVTSSSLTTVTVATSSPLTTTNSNDILLFAARIGANQTMWTAGTAFTIPSNATNTRTAAQYQVVSATQSNLVTSITPGVAGANGENIFAAFQAAPIPGPDITSTILSVSGSFNVAGAMTINY